MRPALFHGSGAHLRPLKWATVGRQRCPSDESKMHNTKISDHLEVVAYLWLGDRDLNPDYLDQNQASYH